MNQEYYQCPLVLEDEKVLLKKMTLGHAPDLFAAGQDTSIWTWTTFNYCKSLELTKEWIKDCLQREDNHQQIPFVIIDKASNKIVGSTSYLNIFAEHKVIEIGYTFLSPAAQRSYINRRCKLLLLNHAFEQLKVNRVALQTNEKNEKSKNAILAIGAIFEGVYRDCIIQADNTLRSSAFFSIIKPEWPQVKHKLIEKIARYAD